MRNSIYILLCVLAGCGGSSTPAGPPIGAEPRPGTVSVRNETPWPLEVAWLESSAGQESTVRRLTVAVASAALLTDGELPAGTLLALDLVLLIEPTQGPRVRRKAQIEVDGDVTLVVAASAADPFDVSLTQ